MSASEKLKALDNMVWSSTPAQRETGRLTLHNALPQIVAVVEAAERLDDLLEMVPADLVLALAALDKALP